MPKTRKSTKKIIYKDLSSESEDEQIEIPKKKLKKSSKKFIKNSKKL